MALIVDVAAGIPARRIMLTVCTASTMPADLERALIAADFLVCSLPSTPETRGLLDARFFSQLDNAFIVNVGRGELIDEEALIAALDRGRVRGAALDVFQTEPLPVDSPLWTHPRVIITPHIANYWVDPALEQIVHVYGQVLAGKTPDHTIARTRGY